MGGFGGWFGVGWFCLGGFGGWFGVGWFCLGGFGGWFGVGWLCLGGFGGWFGVGWFCLGGFGGWFGVGWFCLGGFGFFGGLLGGLLFGLGGIAGLLTLVTQGLLYRADALANHPLRYRLLIFGQVFDKRLAVGSTRAQSLGLGAIVLAARLLVITLFSVASAASILTTPAVTPWAITVSTLAARHQLGGYEGLIPTGAQNLESFGHGTLLLGLECLDDLDAVHVELGLDGQLVTHIGGEGNQIAGQFALGLAGTGGPPGPRAIGPLAGQLNIYPSRHRRSRYRMSVCIQNCWRSPVVWCIGQGQHDANTVVAEGPKPPS